MQPLIFATLNFFSNLHQNYKATLYPEVTIWRILDNSCKSFPTNFYPHQTQPEMSIVCTELKTTGMNLKITVKRKGKSCIFVFLDYQDNF